MEVDVEIGVAEPDQVDTSVVAAVLPYGRANVSVVKGGLDIPSEDGTRKTVIANAAAVIYLDILEAQ
ncbi:MAG: hypothetical protein ACJAY2_003453 [Pseudomonadales bacterium]|jgi:uncharacterized protein (TIGR02058 family)